MSEQYPNLIQKQFEFAAHIRNPEQHPRPRDVEDRRMAIYRELFYNNIEGFISNGFPVLRGLYEDADWHRLVRDFFTYHRCRSPYFLEISREFLEYIHDERPEHPQDPPFLYELAHYEWVELALSVSEEIPDWEHIDCKGDLVQGRPVLSPLTWLLNYAFAVHKIGPSFIPQAPGEQPTYLLVYRNRQDEVGFMEPNPVTARLVTLIQEHPQKTGEQLLRQIAEELRHPQPELVIQGGRQTLMQLKEADIVLGTYFE
ncbi:MAG: putative DNA-binding domain-containing protein [Pseudomonadota bacterium]